MASNLPRAGFKLVVRNADAARQQSFAAENENATAAPMRMIFSTAFDLACLDEVSKHPNQTEKSKSFVHPS